MSDFENIFTKEKDLLLDKITQGLEACCIKVEGDAKLLAPVKTGNLRSSINHRVEDLTGIVGTAVEYAPFVEFGTSRQKPQPFLTKSLEQNKATIGKIMAQAVKDA